MKMTPDNYQQAAIGLCRQFKPITDKACPNSHESTFSGWRVHLNFRHKSSFGPTWFNDWIHICINDAHNLPPFCDHWKWNIHYSGNVEDVRANLLRELLRRLNRLAGHYSHTAPAPKTAITFELPATAAQKIAANPEAFKAAMSAAGFPVESVSVREVEDTESEIDFRERIAAEKGEHDADCERSGG